MYLIMYFNMMGLGCASDLYDGDTDEFRGLMQMDINKRTTLFLFKTAI